MFIGDSRKMKWTSTVEYWAKMDVPTTDWGHYAVLEMNGCEVYRWKLTKLDMLTVFNVRSSPTLSEQEMRIIREVDQDGLDQFIAARISDIFELVLATQTQGRL